MLYQHLEDGWYVFSDHSARARPQAALAGPLPSRACALGWLIEHGEGHLRTPAQRDLWAEAHGRMEASAPPEDQLAQMLAVLGRIIRGAPRAAVLRAAAPMDFRRSR